MIRKECIPRVPFTSMEIMYSPLPFEQFLISKKDELKKFIREYETQYKEIEQEEIKQRAIKSVGWLDEGQYFFLAFDVFPQILNTHNCVEFEVQVTALGSHKIDNNGNIIRNTIQFEKIEDIQFHQLKEFEINKDVLKDDLNEDHYEFGIDNLEYKQDKLYTGYFTGLITVYVCFKKEYFYSFEEKSFDNYFKSKLTLKVEAKLDNGWIVNVTVIDDIINEGEVEKGDYDDLEDSIIEEYITKNKEKFIEKDNTISGEMVVYLYSKHKNIP
jgi:hypothetical protein